MNTPRQPLPSILITGLLARRRCEADDSDIGSPLLEQAAHALEQEFGPIAERSPLLPFDFTDYYESEMGPNLIRQWLGFEATVDPGTLAHVKLTTNRLEARFAEAERRTVNIDPGLVNLHNLVLASTKNRPHRVYIGHNIYAEPTLTYRDNKWNPLDWTYKDYRTRACHEFLDRCRKRLAG